MSSKSDFWEQQETIFEECWKLQADLLEGRFMKEPENVQNIPKVNEIIEIVDIADEKSPGKLEYETKIQETLKAKENLDKTDRQKEKNS